MVVRAPCCTSAPLRHARLIIVASSPPCCTSTPLRSVSVAGFALSAREATHPAENIFSLSVSLLRHARLIIIAQKTASDFHLRR